MLTNEMRLVEALKDTNVVLLLIVNCITNKTVLRLLNARLSQNIDLLTEVGL